MKIKTEPFNLILLVISFLFLFNPNIITIDVLPDFFGYILLCSALSRLSDLSDTVGEAAASFKKLIFFDAAKLFAIVWIYGFADARERTASMMLWSFIFCVIELIFVIPAFLKLFNGITELGNFHKNTSIHGVKLNRKGKAKKRSYTEAIKRLTVIFIAVKSSMSFLPELAELSNSSYDEGSGMLYIYRYIGILRMMAFFVALVFGMVWFFNIVRYFSRIKKDKEFIDSLRTSYNEKILPKIGIFANKYIRNGFMLIITGAIFTLDIRLDNFIDTFAEELSGITNVIPDIIPAAIFLGYVFYMRNRIMVNKGAMLGTSLLLLVASLLVEISEIGFYTRYTFLSVLRSPEGAKAYWIMVALSAVQGIILMAFMLLLAKNIKHIIKEHTGFVLGREVRSEVEEKQIKEFHGELYRPIKYAIAALTVYVASDVLNALQPFCYAYFEAEFGYFSAINIACGIIFIAFLVKALGEIKEAVKTKYMLE